MRLLPLFLCAGLCAQDPTFRATAPLVLVPVVVKDRQGQAVEGLQASDFIVLDDGRPVQTDVNQTFLPVSLVLAVQNSVDAAGALAKLRRSGSLLQPVVVGEGGAAAVMQYDNRVYEPSEWTNDEQKFDEALLKVKGDGEGGRLYDAVAAGVALLRARPARERKVLVLFGEAKDRGSKHKLDEVITQAQASNITVYGVTFSRLATAFTAKPEDLPKPGGFNLMALFGELNQARKVNAMDALARITGGTLRSFTRQKGLESLLLDLGREVHEQYVLSFAPPSSDSGRYHQLAVSVKGRPELQVRARPGYWVVP